MITQIIEAKPLTRWDEAAYAFLAEKERRSGSMRTVDAYSRTLRRFFGMLGKTPDQVIPPDVFGFARDRTIWEKASSSHHQRTTRMRQQLLSFPHPHGLADIEPLRSTGAAAVNGIHTKGASHR